MILKYLALVTLLYHNAFAQIAIFEVELDNLLKMQKGIGWPHELDVVEGHEALLKLSSSLPNMETCEVTTPAGETFDVNQPTNNRFESWSDKCGLRVRNVVKADEGRWRLSAKNGSQSITGWTEVHVQDSINSYNAPPISLHDGQQYTLELTTLDNSYCLVSKPFSDSFLVPGHCRVTLDRTTRAVQGNWEVLLGLPGRVTELHVEKAVAVEAERLDVGYVRDTAVNKLHLYCNILHTSKNITFCRFQKTTESSGYNVMDGLSDGSHSYYGEGFANRQCGITIETVTNQAYGTWRCTVGVQEWEGTHIVTRTPMQALINVPYADSRVARTTSRDDQEARVILVQKDSSFTITCQADVSLMYCWFQHPNGTQYTPLPLADEEQQFWYAGESLQTGDCGITFTHATDHDDGDWLCHMGPRNQLGLEITDRVQVRVTGPLAAVKENVGVSIGSSVDLICHTANGNKPLDYCRFLSPKFFGLRVDSTITEEKAIMDRYFFTPGKSLDHGDCALTINYVTADDIGDWTCAGLLDGDSVEARDTMALEIQASRQVSTAGIIGMAVGSAVLALTLIGILVYKRKVPIPWRRTNESQRTDAIDLVFTQGSEMSSVRTSRSNESTSTTEREGPEYSTRTDTY